VSRIPPEDRPTAQQLAGASRGQPTSFGGQPANVCPACGCAMFAYRTTTLNTRVIRYETCRNCGRKFITRQLHAEIVREVKPAIDG